MTGQQQKRINLPIRVTETRLPDGSTQITFHVEGVGPVYCARVIRAGNPPGFVIETPDALPGSNLVAPNAGAVANMINHRFQSYMGRLIGALGRAAGETEATEENKE